MKSNNRISSHHEDQKQYPPQLAPDKLPRQAQSTNTCTAIINKQINLEINNILPGDLSKTCVFNTSNAALEEALKLCFRRKPETRTVAYLEGGYYGTSSLGQLLNDTGHPQKNPLSEETSSFPINAHTDVNDIDQDISCICITNTVADKHKNMTRICNDMKDRILTTSIMHDAPVILFDTETDIEQLISMFNQSHCYIQPDIIVLGSAIEVSKKSFGTLTCSKSLAESTTITCSDTFITPNPVGMLAAIHVLRKASDPRAHSESLLKTLKVASYIYDFDLEIIGLWIVIQAQSTRSALNLYARIITFGIVSKKPEGSQVIIRIPKTLTEKGLREMGIALRNELINLL